MKRLAIISTHPIQYNAPLFRILAQHMELKVFYTWSQRQHDYYDPTFQQDIEWDIPLLEGYEYTFVENISKSPTSKSYNGIVNPTLIQEVLEWSPSHVCVYGWKFKSHLSLMRKLKRDIPVLFRGDSNLIDMDVNHWKSRLRQIILKRVFKHVDKALYVGTENKKYFLHHGLKQDQLVFAPHAIENERFMRHEYEEDALRWRQELGFSDHDIVVLFAGKFEEKKNPLLLVNAVTASSNSKLKVLMVGNGPLEKDVIDSKLAKQGKMVILPFQNQSAMPKLYRVSDIFCLPSQGPHETWGLATNEAFASRRPAILSDKVGCAYDLIQTQTGWVFRSGSKSQLTKILNKLDKDDLMTKGKAAQTFIENWSYKEILKSIESI